MRYNLDDLYFLGRANVCHHESKELFYERLLNWTAFASLLLSSAAFVSLTPLLPSEWQAWLSAGFALVVTCLNGAVLAMGMLHKYTAHADLKKEWMRFVAHLEGVDESGLPEVVQRFHELNAREPAGEDADFGKAEQKTKIALGWN